ncbi:hypothetical protein Tco_1555088 [Tanacetum coccineum]
MNREVKCVESHRYRRRRRFKNSRCSWWLKSLEMEFAREEQLIREQGERDTEIPKAQAEKELGIMIAELDRSNELIAKVGNQTEVYQTFEEMLKRFDREDLDRLWSLVKKTFSSTDLTEDKEKELWVELKRLYKPDPKDQLWALQRYMHDPLEWRLYDTCGVHHVSTERGHEIFMLVEKDYSLTKGLTTLLLCNKLQVDQYSEMVNELLIKIYSIANSPR